MRHRLSYLVIIVLVFVSTASQYPIHAQPNPYQVLMPQVRTPPTLQPFGFDVRSNYLSGQTIQFAKDALPRWVRAADIYWSEVESTRGVYNWDRLAVVDQALENARLQGIEPIVVIQQSPRWAQKYPGWECSPPAAQYMDDWVRFLEALAQRYNSGTKQVRYWEVGNEPEGWHKNLLQTDGMGCWGNPDDPYYGGREYGAALVRATAALKRGNPQAQVIGGALMYNHTEPSARSFLDGMIISGGVAAIDMLSFHAYGEWQLADWLIIKTNRIRDQLRAYGLGNKPLIATEVGAACPYGVHESCDPNNPNSEFITNNQANYAARIYAESMALGLQGALWYTLVSRPPGFAYSSLIDLNSSDMVPRPAYYAVRNSARLLQDAIYIGAPIRDPTNDEAGKVQVLTFQKPGIMMYVIWVQHTDCLDCPVLYELPVPAGALARCTTNLDGRKPGGNDGEPYYFNCSDSNKDGFIPRAVGELPQYIEVSTTNSTASIIQGLP